LALAKTINEEQISTLLAEWVRRRFPDATDARVGDLVLPKLNGKSALSVMFEALCSQHGVEHRERLVARIAPRMGIFPDYDFAREGKIMNALAQHTSIPVPRVLSAGLEEGLDQPVMVMERREGRVPPDDPPVGQEGWVLDLEPETQSELVDTGLRIIAAIHDVDVEALGLTGLDRPQYGATPVDQLFGYWERYYAWAADGLRDEIIDAAFAWARDNRPDDEGPCVLNWGDARLGNLMFGPDLQVTAVMDWEMATLGNPGLDLGWYLFSDRFQSEGCNVSLPPGFPSAQETIARYERLSGRTLTNMDYWMVWGGIRGTLIMMRIAHVLIESGALPADSQLRVGNAANWLLADILDLPKPTIHAVGLGTRS